MEDFDNIVPLSVVIQNESDLSRFRFEWSTTGKQGHLENSVTPTPLPTTPIKDSSAAYVADLLKLKVGNSDTVTVKVFLASDLTKVIGTATSTITAIPDPPCGKVPPPILVTGPGAPSLTLDKPIDKAVYKAGDILTATLTIAAGNGDEFVAEVALIGAPAQPPFATLLTIDGSPASGTTDVRINVAHPGQAETHVLTFRMSTPTDLDGNPTVYCAGGHTADGHTVGPFVSAEIFNHGGPGSSLLCVTFIDETP